MFGNEQPLFDFTKSHALSKDILYFFIKYDISIAELLEIPAAQWTSILV